MCRVWKKLRCRCGIIYDPNLEVELVSGLVSLTSSHYPGSSYSSLLFILGVGSSASTDLYMCAFA